MTDAEINYFYQLLAIPDRYRQLLATNFNATFQHQNHTMIVRPLGGHFCLEVVENGKWRLSICEQKILLEKINRQMEKF